MTEKKFKKKITKKDGGNISLGPPSPNLRKRENISEKGETRIFFPVFLYIV